MHVIFDPNTAAIDEARFDHLVMYSGFYSRVDFASNDFAHFHRKRVDFTPKLNITNITRRLFARYTQRLREQIGVSSVFRTGGRVSGREQTRKDNGRASGHS